jgi:hypothetical protein
MQVAVKRLVKRNRIWRFQCLHLADFVEKACDLTFDLKFSGSWVPMK